MINSEARRMSGRLIISVFYVPLNFHPEIWRNSQKKKKSPWYQFTMGLTECIPDTELNSDHYNSKWHFSEKKVNWQQYIYICVVGTQTGVNKNITLDRFYEGLPKCNEFNEIQIDCLSVERDDTVIDFSFCLIKTLINRCDWNYICFKSCNVYLCTTVCQNQSSRV
jgi:hypothetical protein